MGVAWARLTAQGGERHLAAVHIQFLGQRPALPPLQIAHHAAPSASASALKHEYIILRIERFEKEYLNFRTGLLAKSDARVDHTRIVTHKQGILREQLRECIKPTVGDSSAIARHNQQTAVAGRERMACYPLVGKRIVKIRYFYIFNLIEYIHLIF